VCVARVHGARVHAAAAAAAAAGAGAAANELRAAGRQLSGAGRLPLLMWVINQVRLSGMCECVCVLNISG